jgi:hypothetical protein
MKRSSPASRPELIAATLTRLGVLHREAGDLVAAEAACAEALDIQERVFPRNYPATIVTAFRPSPCVTSPAWNWARAAGGPYRDHHAHLTLPGCGDDGVGPKLQPLEQSLLRCECGCRTVIVNRRLTMTPSTRRQI